MPAYAIFIKEKTRDAGLMADYGKAAQQSLKGHAVKVLAAYGAQEVLEGPGSEGTVILEFPTVEAAKEWYESPAYAEARQLRFRGGDFRALIVQGL